MQSESCLDTDYDNESHVRFVGRSRARHARICYQNPAFATAMQRREQSKQHFIFVEARLLQYPLRLSKRSK
jgi:uncharacterized protein (DUF1330 family)